MRETAQHICSVFGVDMGKDNKLKSTVFEDNSGALALAKAKRMNPRTKHIAAPYHWFHEQLTEDCGITLEKIATEDQQSDCMTKRLAKAMFLVIKEVINWLVMNLSADERK